MARDKSVVAVVVLFLTLGFGALVGWMVRGAADGGSTDQVISAATLPSVDGSQTDTSILLPRSAEEDEVEDGTPTSSSVTAESADTSDDSENQPAPTNAADEPKDTTVVTGATTTTPTTSGPTLPESGSTTAVTSGPTTTAAPTTTSAVPTTTAVVLTDPSFSAVQFQSPIACTGGSAVSQISWETVDASTVSILVNGETIAADLGPGGVFDANFSCAGDGQHNVELVATGISSDPARVAFTSSVTDQITTEG